MANNVRSVYTGPLMRLTDALLSRDLIDRIAKCIIDTIIYEGQKDFAKRGWSFADPKGGPPFQDSFSYTIRGERTIEIRSSYYGLEELTRTGVPSRRMTWLTQEGRGKPAGGSGGSGGSSWRMGERKPLVVPIKAEDGTVIFRTAPLRMKDAWVHPGIAKFTFMERALRKSREKVNQTITAYLKERMGP